MTPSARTDPALFESGHYWDYLKSVRALSAEEVPRVVVALRRVYSRYPARLAGYLLAKTLENAKLREELPNHAILSLPFDSHRMHLLFFAGQCRPSIKAFSGTYWQSIEQMLSQYGRMLDSQDRGDFVRTVRSWRHSEYEYFRKIAEGYDSLSAPIDAELRHDVLEALWLSKEFLTEKERRSLQRKSENHREAWFQRKPEQWMRRSLWDIFRCVRLSKLVLLYLVRET